MNNLMEGELEITSNSYLMSLVIVMVGLPFPIINLIASFVFYMAHRKHVSYFVRWHCTQAFVSQLPLFPVNSILFWWTVRIFLGMGEGLTSFYFAYLFTVLLFNLVEYVATIFTAIKVRQGNDVKWFMCGPLTDLICKRGDSQPVTLFNNLAL